jgi:hypothetical protein
MKFSLVVLSALVALASLTACSSSLESKSKKLTLGMNRAQVIKALGSDYAPVAARTETDGKKVEVLRFGKEDEGFYTYFRDGELVQWGDTNVLKAIPGGQ